jgi:hypothetical protein
MPLLGSPVVLVVGAGNLLRNGPIDSSENIRAPSLSGDYPIFVVRYYYSEPAPAPPVVRADFPETGLVRCCSGFGQNDD